MSDMIDRAKVQSELRAYLVHESSEIALDVEQIIAALPAAEPAEDVRAGALIKLLRVVYGMADEGCDAPNAAYRWCERIDEVFHRPDSAEQYEDWAVDLPAGILALISEAKP